VLAYRRPKGPQLQMPHFKTFIVADESQPKRFKGRIETVGRKCNRTDRFASHHVTVEGFVRSLLPRFSGIDARGIDI
jgi:hypothetical protein